MEIFIYLFMYVFIYQITEFAWIYGFLDLLMFANLFIWYESFE